MRQDSVASGAYCRITLQPSQQPQQKNHQKHIYLPKPPYLCTVERKLTATEINKIRSITILKNKSYDEEIFIDRDDTHECIYRIIFLIRINVKAQQSRHGAEHYADEHP
jgi:hypothetical protein